MAASFSLTSCAWCCFYGAGIIGALAVYGLLQERLMSIPYGNPPMLFTDSVFLVFCNSVLAVVFAVVMATSNGESLFNAAPLWKYFAIASSSLYASKSQYDAFAQVSFPVQMFGTSCKMMPIMCWGMLVSGKRYGFKDWAIAAAVTSGVTIFLMTGPITGASSESTTYGLFQLALFSGTDAFTYAFQEKLFMDHVTSKYNQILYISLSYALVTLSVLLASGSFFPGVAFAASHPVFVVDAMTLSGAAVAGQWFILSQVHRFGAVMFAATMNMRQVVSLLLSYVSYGYSITLLQILGLALVCAGFVGLFYRSFAGLFSPEKMDKKKQERKPLVDKRIDAPDVWKV